MICCKLESFSSTYLGLPLGARSNLIKVWDSMIEKFRKRLAGWKSRFISMGGRGYAIESCFGLPFSVLPIPIPNPEDC